jgi:acetylornithine/N-succinyldiaminopimelate aminotransferase
MKPFDVYPLLPVNPVKASGLTLHDDQGKKYLDLYGGHAVISVGHAHPHYISRMKNQLDKIAFYSNAVQNSLQEELAEKLGEISGYADYSLFLCNSGAEANENAFKLASFKTGRKKIVAFEGSFHGRTSAAVAATNDVSINAPVNLQHEVVFIPLNDTETALRTIDEKTAAVIIEGIQGVAGIIEPADEFLRLLREQCTKTGAMLILDEVQSGTGRTGDFFAHQRSGIRPDLITLAKGIGNGFPVGAVLIAPVFEAKHGLLGTTFGGNYLACTAALAVLEILETESLMPNARLIGEYMMQALKKAHGVKSVRGRGLMIGIELETPAAEVRKRLLEEYSIFTGSASCKKTIRILPPLNMHLKEAEYFINAFEKVRDKQFVNSF